jgi:hypothetical protein
MGPTVLNSYGLVQSNCDLALSNSSMELAGLSSYGSVQSNSSTELAGLSSYGSVQSNSSTALNSSWTALTGLNNSAAELRIAALNCLDHCCSSVRCAVGACTSDLHSAPQPVGCYKLACCNLARSSAAEHRNGCYSVRSRGHCWKGRHCNWECYCFWVKPCYLFQPTADDSLREAARSG